MYKQRRMYLLQNLHLMKGEENTIYYIIEPKQNLTHMYKKWYKLEASSIQ